MGGRIARALALALALGAAPMSLRPLAAGEPTLGVQVNRAVDRGVEWLRRQQRADGSFPGPYSNDYPAGQTALGAYALAKSLVPADDPAIARAVAFVKSRKIAKTYEAAVSILALDALKDPAHDEWIRLAARWLEENVNAKEGVWAYPFGPSEDHYKTDLSNTQFAVLGLWVAEAHGYRASRDLWERLARVVPGYQAPCGAFFYSTNRGGREGNGSMTTAGLTILSLALERVSANDRDLPYVGKAQKAAAEGWGYLERRFMVDANPDGAFAATDGALYFLYGLERVAALTRRSKIGGHDWYSEGARELISIQAPDGNWAGNTDGTCYALLFLRQATATHLGRAGEKPEGEGVAAPAAPFKAPAEVIRSLSPEGPEPQDAVRLNPNAYSLADLLRVLPADGDPILDFDRPEDLDRIVIAHAREGWPRWFNRPEAKADQPHPGASGFVAVHPESPTVSVRVIRRVRLPIGFPLMRLRVSADPWEGKPSVGDFVLEASVFDGAPHVLRTAVVEAEPPSPAGWKTFDVDLRAYAGKDVLLIAAVAAGGKTPWTNEEGFIDEFSVGAALR